jgi:hypothetical protein
MTLADRRPWQQGSRSTYRVTAHLLFIPVGGTATRAQYIPNQSIVDHSSAVPDCTLSVEPDETGTTLAILYRYCSTVPFLDKIGDKLEGEGDRDIDTWLRNLTEAIEAGAQRPSGGFSNRSAERQSRRSQ